jgi:hypothetical protein
MYNRDSIRVAGNDLYDHTDARVCVVARGPIDGYSGYRGHSLSDARPYGGLVVERTSRTNFKVTIRLLRL